MPYCLRLCKPGMLIFLVFSVMACHNGRLDSRFARLANQQDAPEGIVVEYPLDGTLFPPELPEPRFIWRDMTGISKTWYIRLTTRGGEEIHREKTDSSFWRPDQSTWQKIRAISPDDSVFFTIIGAGGGLRGTKTSSGRVCFSMSKDSVGASLFYRVVPLPFGYAVKNVHEIEWYAGRIDGGPPRRVLDHIPVCANCHSFSARGDIAMDVDYANDKGSYMIAPLEDTVNITLDRIITWSDYRREDGGTTYGLLSQISPDGRHVLSTVKDRSVFVAVDNLEYSQLFFPIKGIVAVYDRIEKRFYELRGAADPKFVQSNPNWSPDGGEILFSRAERYHSSKIEQSEGVLLKLEDAEEFVKGKKEFKYDLFRLPFNGGSGGEAIPVAGASNNGKSNFFARYSPDGKWIVYCQANNFMLLQPDSKLYIMQAGGGTPRLMTCNTVNMNSWHSWSPNSKWLVFSSKTRGPYTQLYLTHIDDKGNDSPPVFLEHLVFENRAANIPEFFEEPENGFRKMRDDFSRNALYYNRLASANILDNLYNTALENTGKALQADSTFYDALKNKLYLNMVLGRSKSREDLREREKAKTMIGNQIQQHPGDLSLYVKRGELRLITDDPDGAIKDGLFVLKSRPGNYDACELLSKTYQTTGQWEKAIPWLKKMLELQPDKTHESFNLAMAYRNTGQVGKALDLLNEIIGRYPNEALFYDTRAGLFIQKGEMTSAKQDYDKAVNADPGNYTVYRERALFCKNNAQQEQAKTDFQKALQLLGEAIGRNPQDAPLRIARAEILEMAGDRKGAFEEYDHYLALWPLNAIVLKKKAMNYYNGKEWVKAIEVYTTILDHFPEENRVLSNRALAWQQAGNLRQALNDLDSAIYRDPGQYANYYFRSGIRRQSGDQAGADRDLRTTITLLNGEKIKRKLDKPEEDMLKNLRQQLQW